MATKTKTNKALLITSIILTVIALVGFAFSMIMGRAVQEMLHPNTETAESGEGSSSSEEAGRAFASVFAAILFLPIWLLAELITVAFSIPSLVMSGTLCGRLVAAGKQAEPEAPKPKRGNLVASIVLIVLNVAMIATCVIFTVMVIA